MTRNPSTDDGPHFISELVRDLAHLRQQQEGIEEKLLRTNAEQIQVRRRLDAVENTLRAIGIRENDLATKEAVHKAMLRGRYGALSIALKIGGPVLVAVSSWVAIQILFAVQHAHIDELINGKPGKSSQQGQDQAIPQRIQPAPADRSDPPAP